MMMMMIQGPEPVEESVNDEVDGFTSKTKHTHTPHTHTMIKGIASLVHHTPHTHTHIHTTMRWMDLRVHTHTTHIHTYTHRKERKSI